LLKKELLSKALKRHCSELLIITALILENA